MYAIHRTQGFILESIQNGEADRRFIILTEAFGRIEARARSVRLERSKLRYGLSPYMLGTYALVRGKSGWHIVGSRDEENVFVQTAGAPQKRKVLEQLARLLTRMVAGEGKHEDLFHTTVTGLRELLSRDVTQSDAIESVIVLRILYLLGYVSAERQDGILASFLAHMAFDDELMYRARQERRTIVRAINTALAASHL